jgi:hypothetical protein
MGNGKVTRLKKSLYDFVSHVPDFTSNVPGRIFENLPHGQRISAHFPRGAAQTRPLVTGKITRRRVLAGKAATKEFGRKSDMMVSR